MVREHGWTIDQWNDLRLAEKRIWIAERLEREKQHDDEMAFLIDALKKKEALTGDVLAAMMSARWMMG